MELMSVSGEVREAHDFFIGTWRFVENAVNRHYETAGSGGVETVWEASSAVAGTLSLMERAQGPLDTLVNLSQP
jgi:hypothetical protein